MTTSTSRREFLRRHALLAGLGSAAPWALNLAAMAEASAQTASDYKALVSTVGISRADNFIRLSTLLFYAFRIRFDISFSNFVLLCSNKDTNKQ